MKRNVSIVKFTKNKKLFIYNPNTLVINETIQNKIEKQKKKKSPSIIIR